MKRLATLFLALVAASCGSTPAKDPDKGAFQKVNPVPPLANKVAAFISVMNRDRTARLTEPVIIDFRLVNVSREEAVVYNELEPGWLAVIEVMDSNGDCTQNSIPDAVKRGRGGKYHYVCLPPGGFVGRQYAVLPRDPRWKLGPGKYSVRVVYRNTFEPCIASPRLTDEDVKDLRERAVVLLLTGLIASNVEEFEIVE